MCKLLRWKLRNWAHFENKYLERAFINEKLEILYFTLIKKTKFKYLNRMTKIHGIGIKKLYFPTMLICKHIPKYGYNMFSFEFEGWSNMARVDFWQTASPQFVFNHDIISLLEKVFNLTFQFFNKLFSYNITSWIFLLI